MYCSSVTVSHEEYLVTPDLSCRAYLWWSHHCLQTLALDTNEQVHIFI